MAKKMAVRNKYEKKSESKSFLPMFFSAAKPSIKKLLKITAFVAIGVASFFIFQTAKLAIYEQWKVTEISINSNLIQVKPSEIAEILKKDEYAYLLQIDVTSLQTEIKKINWVKRVEIRKKWPNTIEIVLEEYRPVAQFNDGIIIDSGKLVIASSQQQMSMLPQINFEGEDQTIQYLEIVEQYKVIQANLRIIGIEVESLNISESLAWTLNVSNEMEIKIGRRQQAVRMERLISTLPMIEDFEEVTMIDLRYNNGFAVSRKKDLDELAG